MMFCFIISFLSTFVFSFYKDYKSYIESRFQERPSSEDTFVEASLGYWTDRIREDYNLAETRNNRVVSLRYRRAINYMNVNRLTILMLTTRRGTEYEYRVSKMVSSRNPIAEIEQVYTSAIPLGITNLSLINSRNRNAGNHVSTLME